MCVRDSFIYILPRISGIKQTGILVHQGYPLQREVHASTIRSVMKRSYTIRHKKIVSSLNKLRVYIT